MIGSFALAAIFYGAMVILAALKLSPHTINTISAYHTVEARLSSITARDITGTDRIIVAVAGVLCLIVFAPLAWQALPRPYLARTDVDLDDHSQAGQTDVAPRAIERAAELAAGEHAQVTDAAARYGHGVLDVRVDVADGEDLPGTLRGVQARVRDALDRHELPVSAVDITLAGLASPTQGD